MFERKETIINNKKYFISHEYIRKVFESNNSSRNIKPKENNFQFRKIESIKKINSNNNQPLVLFHKPNYNNKYNLENKIKKDLIENKGYLTDGGFKKKLLKYHSYRYIDQNHPKNLFTSSYSQNKNRRKNNSKNYIPNSDRTSLNSGLNSRTIQKEYSNTIKNINNRPKIRHKEKKEIKRKNYFNRININIKNRNSLIQKLTSKDFILKNFGKIKYKKNIENIKKNIDFQRKKDYLEHNNISYEHYNKKENIQNGNNNNDNNKLRNLKDIKINDKVIINISKSGDYNLNNNEEYIFENKKLKKRYKNIVDQFEYIHKIKREYNILQKSKQEDNKAN